MQYFSNYPEVISYLYESLPMFQRVGAVALHKDLARTRELLSAIGNPEQRFRSVHIAGTNGKGSSAHMIAAIMQASGYKTGLYTSPHLKDFTERIRLNGKEASREFVTGFINKWYPYIEEIRPSFFETTVAMAFELFARENVDLAVVEVGMGGRLDSTNVVVPLVSLITSISYDHQQYLGTTLPEIAAEKAGIIKPGVRVVIGRRQEEVIHVFEETARSLASELTIAEDQWKLEERSTGLAVYEFDNLIYSDLQPDLKGDYINSNLPGILATCSELKQYFNQISNKSIENGIQNTIALTGIRGRWQLLQEEPRVICDVGHNEDGVRMVTDQLSRERKGKLYMVWGSVNDKDLDPILALLPVDAYYIFTQPDIPRAMPASELQVIAGRHGLKGIVRPDVNSALEWALELAEKDDLVFIGGSTFVVAGLDRL